MTVQATCQRCGNPVDAGARFCQNCGANVSDVQGDVATRMVSAAGQTAQMADMMLEQLREATLGEYEVLTELGRGGMATVYLAHDLQLDRKVAIKVMDPALLKGEGMVERFKLEARTAAQLSHPHIIPIYAVRHEEQLLYFVMKFVEGRPLDSIVGELGKLPIPMVQSILSRVGEALGYAHRRGVVHRDIKPPNLMIDVEGLPVVTDFGIAKVADTHGLTMTGATIGTPTYMSPEQCAAGAITGASDQYSLGVVAYEMLTGRTPFPGDSIVSLLYKHVHEPPPPFMELRPDCPPEIHEAVMKMLAKKPEERFPHLDAAVQAIGNLTLAFDDPVRTQLVGLAKKGTNLVALRRVSTPRSPTPIRSRKLTARPATRTVSGQPSQAGVATQVAAPATAAQPARRRPRTLAVAAVAFIAVAGGALALLRPWERAGSAAAQTAADALAPASLAIQPPGEAITAGTSVQLGVTALDSAGRQLTAPVTWSSDDPSIASVSQGGMVEALAAGVVTIRASSGAARDSAVVTVAAAPEMPAGSAPPDEVAARVARIRVDGSPGSLDVGATAQLTAATLDRGGRTVGAPVTWSSSDPSRARVSGSGFVTALASGAVTLTARAGTVSQPVSIRITEPEGPPPPPPVRVASVSVTGPGAPMTVGATARLGVTVQGDDGRPHSATVAWRSQNPAVATVSAGVVTAVGPGTTLVTASAEDREGSVTVSVAAPVSAPPPPPEVSPREAIGALIQQYARALQSGQVSEVRRVYPGVTREQASAVQALGGYEQLQVQLRVSQLDVQGDDATARVSGEYQFYSPENRRNVNLNVRLRMSLQNQSGQWRITRVDEER